VTTTGTPPAPGASQYRSFVTPEGVDLRLRVGTAGERAAAFLLDAAIVLATLIAFVVAIGTVAVALASLGAPGLRDGLGSAVFIVWLLGFFFLRNFYFVFFELGARAATPGKRVMGLRVAARDGGRLTAEAVFARNAMREIEIFLPLGFLGASAAGGDPVDGVMVLLGLTWSGVFLLFPLFNRDRLRVGDFVAGTWVVKAPRRTLTIDLAHDAAERLTRFTFTADQAGA
jgi:uncharacterized RDD family membrane protein YckC